MKKSQLFYLTRVKRDNLEKEYFHFDEMRFDSEKPKRGVKLSTIDAMTSLFDDENDFILYINRDSLEGNNYNYQIEYKLKPVSDPKTLDVVWNNPTISALSKISENKVDFTGTKQFDTLNSIMNELKDPESGFIMHIMKPDREDIRISDKARAIVNVLNISKDDNLFHDFIEQFKDYKDFRSLFLGYEEYKKTNNKAKIIIKSWHQKG